MVSKEAPKKQAWPRGNNWWRRIESCGCVCSTRQQTATAGAPRGKKRSALGTEVGQERTYTGVAALVDTHILVYRFDSRFPEKQKLRRSPKNRTCYGCHKLDDRLMRQWLTPFQANCRPSAKRRNP
jgi:hypothetical protein